MAIDGKLTRKRQLAFKLETTEGTAETLADADAAYIPIELEFVDDQEKLAREIHRDTLTKIKKISGKHPCMVRFRHEMIGSGSLGTQPVLGKLLQACGFLETITASTDVVYKPSSNQSDWSTATIGVWEDGTLKVMRGAMGKPKEVYPTGGIPYIEFEFMGVFSSEASASAFDPTLPTELPQTFQNATLTLDSNAYLGRCEEFSIDYGNDVQPRLDPNASGAIRYFQVVNRDVVISASIEAPPIGTYDIGAKHRNNTSIALSLVHGSGEGNEITVAASDLVIDSRSISDKNGFVMEDLEFSVTGDDDDEITITYEGTA